MVQEGLLTKWGQKRGTEYQLNHFPRWNLKESPQEEQMSQQSQEILALVRRPVFLREPVTYSDDWLDAYKPNQTFYFSSQARSKLDQAGRRFQAPAGTYARQLFNRLLIDLSYNSSRLEGNTYSLLDTQKLLLEGKVPKGKLREETLMILNHKEAIRYLVDSAFRLQVNEETIYQLHYLLSQEFLETSYAGKICDHGVRIGGSSYIPSENPRELQIRLSRILKKAALIQDPYEQSFFLLIHLSYLQAFSDVNKRTARLAANIPLIKCHLIPVSFNEIEKDDYNSALIAIYELQKPEPLAELYAFSYLRTCIMYESTMKTVSFDEIKALYRFERRAIMRDIILKRLKGPALDEYIRTQAAQLIPFEDQEPFFEDTLEDLNNLDPIRIAGLGVTKEELNAWRSL